jgi:hypothetical protein
MSASTRRAAAELATVVAEASRLEDEAQAARRARNPGLARDLAAQAATQYSRKRELTAIIAANGRPGPIRYDSPEATGAWDRRSA